VRICRQIPTTATAKILTRELRAEGLSCTDPVWIRSGHRYVPIGLD
jgi:hypothetical protein